MATGNKLVRVAHCPGSYEAALEAYRNKSLHVDWGRFHDNVMQAHRYGWKCWPWYNKLSKVFNTLILLLAVICVLVYLVENTVEMPLLLLVGVGGINLLFDSHCQDFFKKQYIETGLQSEENFLIAVSTPGGADFWVPSKLRDKYIKW